VKYLQIQGGDFAPIAQKVKILKKEKTMALIIANKITLHGNEQIKNLEKQILERLYKDIKKNKASTSAKRVFFGLDEDAEFNWTELIGTPWADFQKQDGKDEIVFISAHPPIKKLQEHITFYAAKIDLKVVVQLDYEDIDGVVIGTRLTAYKEGEGVKPYRETEHTPIAENVGLSRGTMKSIKSSQRRNLREQLINELGPAYRYLKLV